MLSIRIDREEIRRRAYFLSLQGIPYNTLVNILVKLDFIFDGHPDLHFDAPGITIDIAKLRKETADYATGKWLMLRTSYYLSHCKFPPEILHWLIAERQFVIDRLPPGSW